MWSAFKTHCLLLLVILAVFSHDNTAGYSATFENQSRIHKTFIRIHVLAFKVVGFRLNIVNCRFWETNQFHKSPKIPNNH